MKQTPTIQRLSLDARQKLRASFIITDAPHAIDELVCNSIDANATDISVYLDLHTFSFCVRDNGTY